MKKLLALVLALVMTLSLCVTSNAAFSGEEFDYDEAVNVMALLGVFQGDENGKFNGKAELTREQAAKLIAYLDLGEKTAEALPAVKVFNDVEADRWSAKYIAYCADAGYLAGVGDGNFDPTGKLTGYAFGKMLLCVLGFDAAIEGFTGANWTIAVAKLMQSNDIAKDVDLAASATLTREAAAQYCFNALKADKVAYDDKGTGITVGGVEIKTGASAAKTIENKADNQLFADKTLQLAEDLYGDKLTVKEESDELGHVGNKWYYQASKSAKVTKTAVFAEEADYTLTLAKDYSTKGVTSSTYAAAAKKLVDGVNKELGFTKSGDKLIVDGDTVIVFNGDVVGDDQYDLYALADKGVEVELYVTTTAGKKHVDRAVFVAYGLVEVTKVSDLSASELKKIAKKVEDGTIDDDSDEALATKKVYINGNTSAYYYDTEFAGFNYAKNDFVLVVANSDEEILASKLAETVSGKVTATKGDNKFAIDGVYYTSVLAAKDQPAISDEGEWALNAAGKLAAVVDVTTKSSDYAYVYNTAEVDADKDEDGNLGDASVKAYLILADGTKASYVIDEDEDAEVKAGMVIAYVINKDGYLEVGKASDTIGDKVLTDLIDKKNASVDGKAYANGETEFVFVKNTEKGATKKVSAEVVTGYKNVKIDDQYVVAVSKDDVAKLVFVVGANQGVETSKTYAVMVDSGAVYTKNADKDEFMTVVVAVDGEEMELTVSEASYDKKGDGVCALSALKDGDIFAYTMAGDDITVAKKFNGSDVEEVTVANADYFVAGKQYALSDTEIYTVTIEDDDVTVAVADELAEEDLVVVAKTNTDGDTAQIVFVIVNED